MNTRLWMFTSYQFKEEVVFHTLVQGAVVSLGNSLPCKAIGQGSVQTCPHDGSITTLLGINHTPKSRFKLILYEP